ncbi:MAG: UDP-N-acetylmuramoyl-L-alanyl-D-glutamate--2,6-diaminopimelate ligase [Actinomycetota bacterium]
MKLKEIAAMLPAEAAVEGDAEINDLVYDSRKAAPGALFFCLRGHSRDGHEFIEAVSAAGVAALVCERPPGVDLPHILVPDSRAAMNTVAAPFYGHPAAAMKTAGITGTNGKTTVAFMLESIFAAAGEKSGLVGTVATRPVSPARAAHGRTTPESADFQAILRDMADHAVTACAAEVTSIGLACGRVAGTKFDVAVFTNLSADHLDFHGDMESYYRAKASLFTSESAKRAVVNISDPYGRRLAGERQLPAVTFGAEGEADFYAAGQSGEAFTAHGPGVAIEMAVALPGRFNISNALAATAAAVCLGVPEQAIAAGVAAVETIPGRMEAVEAGQDFRVFVDFAHTPAALANVLEAAGELGGGRVIAVFGCGGNRDVDKRPAMGGIAAGKADIAIATSDNPRSEDPLAILKQVEQGMASVRPAGSYRIVPDRREAIGLGIALAHPGDVVVIAGKGHETYQETNGRKVPFDDRKVAAEVLAGLR